MANKIFPHNSCIGCEITTSKNETELIDDKKYQNTFPNSYPQVTSFQLISLSDNVKVQINDGEVLTLQNKWQITFNSNVKVNSCKILTNGANVIWSGILS